MLEAIVSLGGIGLSAAILLGLASKKFAVEVDPRELEILDALPGANCGACGFPGCAGFARALAEGKVDPAACTPGGQATIERLASILGVSAKLREPEVAVVICQGDRVKAKDKYRYLGVEDCNAAQKLADGPKACPGGCLGLGSCVRACPFGAIEITKQGLAVISREKCTGCTKCIAVCPRQVIRMVPASATVHVLCNSHDKGAVVRKYCQVGCIACQICKKAAPEAYVIEDFLARVVYAHHGQAAPAIEKCPTHCIRDFIAGYPEGSTFAPSIVPTSDEAA
ncbi:RnfABCDGE type electron transport complex subunit B [Geoalkalibacter subterraneus]|jgi:electron transport complex protein RnfB|uniref:Ion-translocating oxidoreductase complex subunit B n=1 Tax=Geoalkalibacter subterraneus TaxID=483547 RepID=A0A0B5FP54_9BACT|nr:RnfABCDGE type electron transport complex subunit B [Geoalkalibacter subterraneus]AJF05386.1 ferredoxin [Geoalkalibacter subterraneus]